MPRDYHRSVLPLAIVAAMTCLPQRASPQQTTESSETATAIENEVKRQLARERLEEARRDLRALHTEIEAAHGTLLDIETRQAAFAKWLGELLTDDDGKRIAQDEKAANAVLRIREQPVARAADIKAKKDAAAALVQLLSNQLQDPSVGYAPQEKTSREVHSLFFWATERSAELSAQESTVRDLIEKAPPLSDHAAPRPLGQVLDEYVAARLRLWAELIRKGEEKGREESQKTLIDTARLGELERAEAEKERIETQAKIEADRVRLEYELKLQQAKQEEEDRRTKTQLKLQEAQAELKRLKQIEESERHARDVEAKKKAEKTFDTAETERKKAEAQRPEVRDLLKPFLAPGYWQPGQGARVDKTPMSLSALRKAGALERTTKGLETLIGTANSPQNDRPKWGYKGRWKHLSEEQREEVKKAQAYLDDLGEAMVEAKMLEP